MIGTGLAIGHGVLGGAGLGVTAWSASQPPARVAFVPAFTRDGKRRLTPLMSVVVTGF